MLEMEKPNPFAEGIGASFPLLKKGNVKLQVMAMFTATGKGSAQEAVRQSEIFRYFLSEYSQNCYLVKDLETLSRIDSEDRIGMIASIENASGLCEEDEDIEVAFDRLEEIISNVERLLYIGFTHHPENRFGGGNNSSVGLKEDGKKLLDYLSGRRIAVDFSHASDALAWDILNYIDERQLDISIIASHSNYRSVWDHNRNLPDALAKEIISRGGLIGLNFLRAFMNDDDSTALYDHIQYGLELGGEQSVCFGADYFNTDDHPDRSRVPFYYPEHFDASKYPSILNQISDRNGQEYVSSIACQNVKRYLKGLWS